MTQSHNPYENAPVLDSLTLGQQTRYDNSYDPKLLQPVPRSLNRDSLNLGQSLPFHGEDIWTGYELSWLNAKGKPVVAIADFRVAFDSHNLVESKSFKLYLNSFNQQRFDSVSEVETILASDLSECAQGRVEVTVIPASQFHLQQMVSPRGDCIDELDISVDNYSFDPALLEAAAEEKGQEVEQRLYSNLLKSNCLVTDQPDWGSVEIHYVGPKIDQEALLRYLISFRQHNEFHEQCVERIFSDLMQYCHCRQLTVYARYTRRGGLDINPFRSNFEQPPENHRQARQ